MGNLVEVGHAWVLITSSGVESHLLCQLCGRLAYTHSASLRSPCSVR